MQVVLPGRGTLCMDEKEVNLKLHLLLLFLDGGNLWYTAWICYTVSCMVRNNCIASSFPPGDSFPIFVRFKPCAHVCI